MVSYNLTPISVGGNGCIACLLSPTTSRHSPDKVCAQNSTASFFASTAVTALGHASITCSSIEFSVLEPPTGLTCSQYMDAFIEYFGGYLANPDATSECQFCSAHSTDTWLEENFSIYYSHRWRNVGILFGFVAFNVG